MESFFHLLLFCAVRYLPHNFQDAVPALMHEYFEAYSTSVGEYFCGAAKLAATTCGRVLFPSIVGSLTFFLSAEHRRNVLEAVATPAPTSAQNTFSPSSRLAHPINAVFSRLLRWIQAHYALTNEANNPATELDEVLALPADEANVEPTEEERWFMEKYGMDDEEEEHEEEALDVDELSPKQRAAFKKVAAKLKEHKHVLSLFRRSMSRSKKLGAWLRSDKVPDQLRLDSPLGN